MRELKVVFVGAESTGTTTTSSLVASQLRSRGVDASWVPEYGREFTWVKLNRLRELDPAADMDSLSWGPEDFEEIASKQNELEDAVSEGVLIADTDSWATTLWERRYLGEASEGTLKVAAEADPAAFYFVTSHEGVPFEQDGIRDGEHLRADMTDWFVTGLTEKGVPFMVLEGPLSERVDAASAVIENLLLSGG